MTHHPTLRGSARHVARATAVISAAMLAVAVWLSFTVDTARAAGEFGGFADVVTPVSEGDPGGVILSNGTQATPFSLRLPAAAACPGDSANDGYRVTSYFVPVETDPADLVFSSEGPVPVAFSTVRADFSQPLFTVNTSAYTAGQTANAVPPPGPGLIVNVPGFTMNAFDVPGSEFGIPPGQYNIGLACIVPAPAGSPVERYWNTQLTFDVETNWVVEEDLEVPTTTTTTSSTSTSTSTTSTTIDPETTSTTVDPDTTSTTIDPDTTTTTSAFALVGTNDPTSDPFVASNGAAVLGSASTGGGSLPVTGSSLSMVFWGLLCLVSGRIAVLLSRIPEVLPGDLVRTP